jgi:hypothetical protein
MGKRGGVRVIYFWDEASETFYRFTFFTRTPRARAR